VEHGFKQQRNCGSCPDGWILKFGYCYFLNYTRAETWDEANQYCKKMNSILAIPTNSEEVNFIFSFSNVTFPYFWIGGFRNNELENKFKLNDGQKLELSNPLWCMNYPIKNETANCLEIGLYRGYLKASTS
jgi:hypothetical protein